MVSKSCHGEYLLYGESVLSWGIPPVYGESVLSWEIPCIW